VQYFIYLLPHSILVVADLDVSRHILCIDTSGSATTNMERREYLINFCGLYVLFEICVAGPCISACFFLNTCQSMRHCILEEAVEKTGAYRGVAEL
jgi:hypothetical protein